MTSNTAKISPPSHLGAFMDSVWFAASLMARACKVMTRKQYS